jgi:hypothetical protein
MNCDIVQARIAQTFRLTAKKGDKKVAMSTRRLHFRQKMLRREETGTEFDESAGRASNRRWE